MKRSVTVRRFEAGADAGARREFAQKLIAALTDLDVPPGGEFVVTTHTHLEGLESEIREKGEELANHEAAVKDADDAIEGIRAIVEDYRLGLLDRDEMLRAVKNYAVQYV